jgi:hypothetical protein
MLVVFIPFLFDACKIRNFFNIVCLIVGNRVKRRGCVFYKLGEGYFNALFHGSFYRIGKG